MADPLKELDKALGIVSDVDKLQKEPWSSQNYIVMEKLFQF